LIFIILIFCLLILSFRLAFTVRDRFGNLCNPSEAWLLHSVLQHVFAPTSTAEVEQLETVHASATMQPVSEGQYLATFIPCVAGEFVINVVSNETPLVGGPYPLIVVPSDPSVAKCSLSGHADITCVAGSSQRFALTSRDMFENVRIVGHDAFEVVMDGSISNIVQHVGDGVYDISVEPTKAGQIEVGIKFWGSHVAGSPFIVNVLPTNSFAGRSSFYFARDESSKKLLSVSGNSVDAIVICRDMYGNIVTGDVSALLVTCSGTASIDAAKSYIGDGKWQFTFHPTIVGQYHLRAFIADAEIEGSSLSCVVEPASTCVSKCIVTGVPELCKAGEFSRFVVRVCDEFDNDRTTGGDRIVVETDDSGFSQIVDNNDGTYDVSLTLQRAGSHSLPLRINGVECSHSPLKLACVAASAKGTQCIVINGGISKFAAGEDAAFVIETRDEFGNVLNVGGSAVSVEIEGQSAPNTSARDEGNGRYECKFRVFTTGDCLVSHMKCSAYDHTPPTPKK
jgi:hypothetical protein